MLTTDANSGKLPANAAPVFVDMSVTVGDPNLESLWLGCKVRLVDSGGRSWSPTYVDILPSLDDRTNCNSAAYSGAKPGDTLKIRETFMVPKEALTSVRAVVGVSSERPYYLRSTGLPLDHSAGCGTVSTRFGSAKAFRGPRQGSRS